MVRSLRFEYACVVCHVMARGGGGKAVFIAKDAHLLFLHWLCDEKGKLLASRKGDPLSRRSSVDMSVRPRIFPKKYSLPCVAPVIHSSHEPLRCHPRQN